MIGIDNMTAVLDRVEDLPTLPTVYTKVSNLMKNPKTSVSDLTKIIEVDQALTTKILRLVNSSFFGFSRKIISINQAIVLLGFNTIRNTVLSVSVFGGFKGMDSAEFELRQFWKHAISCGVISTIIDKKLKTGFKDDTFVAGLLHDIGKIILSRYFPNEFSETISYAKKNQLSFFESEKTIVGFSHAEIGEYLTDRWQLPFSLVEVASLHHQPDNIRSNPKLVSIIHIANAITYRVKLGFLSFLGKPKISQFALEELNISLDSFTDLLVEVKEEVKNSEDVSTLLL